MKRFLIFMTLLAVMTSLGVAQVTTASILGRVVDGTGGVVPGASITADNAGKQTTRSVITDDSGSFTLDFLPVGEWTVTVDMPGFNVYEETGLLLRAGEKLGKTIELTVGSVDETITVTSAAAQLNTVNAQDNIRLSESDLKELPVFQRDITNVLTLGAGSSGGAALSLNGLPPRGFVFTIDGSYANPDPELPGIGMYQNFNVVKGMSIDAIAEIQTSKNVFSAETANAVGGNVNVISKTGTNEFHGSMFWNYQAGGLNARYQFNSGKAPLVFHQFGASAGGAIIEDEMFIFGAWESYRLTASSSVSGGVPSTEIRSLMLASEPLYKTWLDGWPTPTSNDLTAAQGGTGQASFSGTGAEEREDDHFIIRWYYHPNQTNSVNFRYTYFDPSRTIPRVQTLNSRSWIGGQKAYSGAWTMSAPTWSNELRGGLNSTKFIRQDALNRDGIMGAYLDGWDSQQSRLFGKDGETLTLENVIATTKGDHSLKFGGIYQWQRGNRVSNGTPRCFYDAAAGIISNTPTKCFYRFGKKPKYVYNWQVGGFLQDDWRVNSKLVVNLGLRYDYYSVVTVEDDAFFNPVLPFGQNFRSAGNYYNSDPINFAPRVSFAYSADDKTVIKGGYGMFISRFNTFSGIVDIQRDDTYTNSIWLNATETASLGCAFHPKYVTGFEACDNGTSAKAYTEVDGYRGGGALDPDVANPASQQWTFGIQRQLSEDIVLDLSYVGSHGTRLQNQLALNRGDRVTGVRPYADVSGVAYNSNDDSSVYHSLQVELSKRFSAGLTADFAYTWAKSLSYSRGDMSCCGSNNSPQDISHPEPSNPNGKTVYDQTLNRGWVSHQTPHRATVSWLYEIPGAEGAGKAQELLTRGWGIGGIFEASTGSVRSIRQSGGTINSSRPDFVCQSLHSAYNSSQSNMQYFNKSCFETVGKNSAGNPTRAGNLARNTFFDPGFWEVDLSLSKKFYVTDTAVFSVRMDLFNAFNQTNFRNTQTSASSGTFGVLRSTYGARVTQVNARLEW